MTKVLVTGVGGRIGSSLTQHLLHDGYDVRGMVRPDGRRPDREIARDIEIVEAWLTDTEALGQAVAGTDMVVHLAAQMGIGDTDPERYFDINVGGTLRLLEAAVNQRPPVRRFVFTSTDNTYGPAYPQAQPITEESRQVPGDYYGTSKVLAERLVQNYHKLYGLEYTILRLGSVVAPNEATALFRHTWTRAFLAAHYAAGRRSNLWPLLANQGDPTLLLDTAVGSRDDNPAIVLTGPDKMPWSLHLTDVRDAVTGIVLGMERDAAANDEFNIIGPNTTTCDDAAAAIARHDSQAEAVTVQMPVKLAFELSIAKARRTLGYTPAWDFEGMLSTALDRDVRSQPRDYVPVGAA
ncbi:NAD(P)-dependent oxidoreductase [Actinobacteria bacterium YIM 96077]|uniref:NAD-dependent epimerase/dehydratase domain-containing protein n=1 Tax=Phytoactinopolyspora halophila TaxID=1981511 RepID=A0A329QHZ9_9ACTN|nr:NAD(P)-dependent oxidoreductase [Phytoactinopolyspora halophila]AYY12427.1 NAD(P)-dependent oxidoreductase [Actinobacteria bacterium YIM 96077]RAW11995.1 hypothetical protein DPM12_15045 [Phytoactinopolyspora halophila]